MQPPFDDAFSKWIVKGNHANLTAGALLLFGVLMQVFGHFAH